MNPLSLVISLLIFVLILRGVIQGSKKPLQGSGLRLLIPLLYISTSLLELLDPSLELTTGRVVSSLCIGAVLSIPLMLLTQFQTRADGQIYYKRNVYLYILIVLIFAIRFFDFTFISGIDPKTLGFLNNLTTLSYISLWRISSFIKFKNTKSRVEKMKIV